MCTAPCQPNIPALLAGIVASVTWWTDASDTAHAAGVRLCRAAVRQPDAAPWSFRASCKPLAVAMGFMTPEPRCTLTASIRRKRPHTCVRSASDRPGPASRTASTHTAPTSSDSSSSPVPCHALSGHLTRCPCSAARRRVCDEREAGTSPVRASASTTRRPPASRRTLLTFRVAAAAKWLSPTAKALYKPRKSRVLSLGCRFAHDALAKLGREERVLEHTPLWSSGLHWRSAQRLSALPPRRRMRRLQYSVYRPHLPVAARCECEVAG
jgi:hypothetical protein